MRVYADEEAVLVQDGVAGARRRVSLTSLYLGTGTHEREIVGCCGIALIAHSQNCYELMRTHTSVSLSLPCTFSLRMS